MENRRIIVLAVVAFTLLPLKMLNMNEILFSPSNIAEKANAAVETQNKGPQQAVFPVVSSMDVWVTAYASVPGETDDTPFITASNKYVEDGFVASNSLPFGTKVKIPRLFGDKVFTVEDRMSERKTDFVDVWMPTVAGAKNFGIHRAELLVLGDTLSGHIAER